MPIPEGSFVWHDLATTDIPGAKSFYQAVLRWTTKPWEDAQVYTMWMNGDTPIGGLAPMSEKRVAAGESPHWLPFVYVYDVDACTRQAVKLGGSIRKPPKEFPNAGSWSVIRDPAGTMIGLFEPTQSPLGHTGAARRGEFSWHELRTTDYKVTFDFYSKLFRWEKMDEHDMGEMGVYLIFGHKGQTYGGMFNRTSDMPAPDWLSYVRVDNATAAAESVKQAGGTVLRGPHEVPGGDMIAMCADPAGAMFAVHTPK